MKRGKRITTAAIALGGTLLLTAGGCTGQTDEQIARDQAQSQKAQGETLEKKNLAAKKEREENPSAVHYLYLYTYGQPMGYYVTKGKISSSGSQRTPEQDIVHSCGGTTNHYECSAVVVDGPQDDGSYGAGDPGIFFFLADGTMVETSFDYVISDRPIAAVNVPLLGGSA